METGFPRDKREAFARRSCSNPKIMKRSASWPRELHLSSIARMFPDQAPSPSRSEQVTPLGIVLVEIQSVDDTVGSKAAEIPAQLAPCRQKPHGFEIADGDRPDGAFAVTAVFVAIAQCDLLSFVNLRTRPRHVDAVRFYLPRRPGAAGGFQGKRSQPLGGGVGDLRHQALGRSCEDGR